MSFCDRINLKFWKNWDPFGSKRLARMEKRIAELEAEVMAPPGGLWAYMTMSNLFFDSAKECKPVKLTLRDKVNRLCDHIGVIFEKQDAKYVLTVKKPTKYKKRSS